MLISREIWESTPPFFTPAGSPTRVTETPGLDRLVEPHLVQVDV